MGTPLPIEVANLGMADSLILMVMALVVFGPRRLPQIGRQIGKLMYEFRKASNDFKFQMEEELRVAEEADRRKKEEAERQRMMSLAAPAQTIEAQAGIGAVEAPSASPYPGEGQYPAQYPPETPATEAEPVSTVPRIQPPVIGEQVSAPRPGHADPILDAPGLAMPDNAVSDDTDSVTHIAVNGQNAVHSVEPAAEAGMEVVAVPDPKPDPKPGTEPVTQSADVPSEPVSQHG
jgi:sec-independent protein translocase protein TatB